MKILSVSAAVISAGLLLGVQSAKAVITVKATQVGADVDFTMTGSLASDSVVVQASDYSWGQGIQANPPHVIFGPGFNGTLYSLPNLTGPTSFGSGGFDNPSGNSGTASYFTPEDAYIITTGGLDTALSASMTFANATFSSLGVTPGTYIWSWGPSAAMSDSYILQIEPTSVPDTGTTFGLLGVSLAGLVFLRRAVC